MITVFFALVFASAKANDVERAESFVQKLSNQIILIVENDLTLNKKQQKLLNIFKRNASITTISRAALGTKWRTLNDNTREEFTDVFTQYLVRKYSKQFEEFSGAKLIVERSIDAGKKGVLVYTRLIMPATSPISVKWQVWRKTGNLKLIDIIIEDISMLTMEREEVKNRLTSNNNNIRSLINDLRQNYKNN
jgi:phospholipid transport system substrate-binding protein